MRRLELAGLSILALMLAGCISKELVLYVIPETYPTGSGMEELLYREATYSILVQSEAGDTLLSYNAEKLLIPASTQKLITAAIAWKYLGNEYRLPTFIGYEGFSHNNIVFGNLVVTGTGDPTLDSRHWLDPQNIFSGWADSLKAHGITEIRGNVIGNDNLFEDQHLGSGWAWDDLSFSYGAEFGPLMADNTSVEIYISPSESEIKSPAIISNLPFEYFSYKQLITYNDTLPEHIHVRRYPGQNQLSVFGNYGAENKCYNKIVTAPNPTLFYANMLIDALRNAGITISGYAKDIDECEEMPEEIHPVFTYNSPPLELIIGQFLKYSNNQAGEALLRHVAWHETGFGSFNNSVMILEVFMERLGISKSEYRFADASGLSRYNLVSSAVLNKLLFYMKDIPEFRNSLAKVNTHGTLSKRAELKDLDLRAKTGSMSRIECISGYMTTKRKKKLIFTVMINNYALRETRHPADIWLQLFDQF